MTPCQERPYWSEQTCKYEAFQENSFIYLTQILEPHCMHTAIRDEFKQITTLRRHQTLWQICGRQHADETQAMASQVGM